MFIKNIYHIILSLILFVGFVILFLVWLLRQDVPTIIDTSLDTNIDNYESDQGPNSSTLPDTSSVVAVNKSEVVSYFDDFLNKEVAVGEVKTSTMTKQGRPVGFKSVADALDVKIDQNVNKLIDESAWTVNRCGNDDSAVILNLLTKNLPDYSGNLYKDRLEYFKNWESSIVYDLEALLFPSLVLDDKIQVYEFTNDLKAEAMVLRETSVKFKDGTEGYFGYIIIGDDVIIGTNKNCLLKVQKEIFDLEA